jgi:hypothetical protein
MSCSKCPICDSVIDPLKQRCFASFSATLPWFADSKRLPISYARPDFGTLHWACDSCIDQGRALLADPTKQTYCDSWPYYAYRDKRAKCEDCGSEFVFEATEQKHWYESLDFWVQSYPKRCKTCYAKRRGAQDGSIKASRRGKSRSIIPNPQQPHVEEGSDDWTI